MRTPIRSFAAVLALAAGVAGCNAGQASELAQDGAAVFHDRYSEEEFQAIYAGGDPEMRAAMPDSQATRIFGLIHRKLGRVKSVDLQGSSTNVGTGGTRVTLVYTVQYERGQGTETLAWRVRGDSARLTGFNVNSPALLE